MCAPRGPIAGELVLDDGHRPRLEAFDEAPGQGTTQCHPSRGEGDEIGPQVVAVDVGLDVGGEVLELRCQRAEDPLLGVGLQLGAMAMEPP